MDHFVMEGRGFKQAFNSISKQELSNLRLPYINTASVRPMTTAVGKGVGEADPEEAEAEPVESKSGKKIKYTCGCGTNVWGKSGLDLHCNRCDTDFQEQ